VSYIPQNRLADYREKHKPLYCPILGELSNDWVVDHDHRTGLIRGVLSRKGNSLLGKVENFFLMRCGGDRKNLPGTLRRMADFLENPPASSEEHLHPVGLKQLTNRFKRNLNKEDQEFALKKLGAKKSEINACQNVNDRSALYRTLVKTNYTKHE
jgi:hypothetical protein